MGPLITAPSPRGGVLTADGVQRARAEVERARSALRAAELRYDNAQAELSEVCQREDELRTAERAHIEAWWEALPGHEQTELRRSLDGPLTTHLVEALEDAGFAVAGAHWANAAPLPDFHLPQHVRECMRELVEQDPTV